MRVPWTARRSNQSVVKEINPEYSLEGLMLKLQYFGHRCWERLRGKGEGVTEDEMVGWHHQLNGHEFKQAPEVGDGQGSLVCYSPRGHKESDTTE